MADSAPIVYTDFAGLAGLRYGARQGSDTGVRRVAEQFASVFLQMMLKSVRDATPEGGLFDGDQMDMYHQMFDSQFAIQMAESGGMGLVDLIERQLKLQQPVESTTPAAGPEVAGPSGSIRPAEDGFLALPEAPAAIPATPNRAAGGQTNPVDPLQHLQRTWRFGDGLP